MGEVMNIIELAKQAGLQTDNAGVWVDDGYINDQLERFAELVAAHEREACCAIVYGLCESDNVAQRTVDAIRARGDT
jgi:hypothetical protein